MHTLYTRRIGFTAFVFSPACRKGTGPRRAHCDVHSNRSILWEKGIGSPAMNTSVSAVRCTSPFLYNTLLCVLAIVIPSSVVFMHVLASPCRFRSCVPTERWTCERDNHTGHAFDDQSSFTSRPWQALFSLPPRIGLAVHVCCARCLECAYAIFAKAQCIWTSSPQLWGVRVYCGISL